MRLVQRIEHEGRFLFRWRSFFLPLVLMPLTIVALAQGGTLNEYREHVWLTFCVAISFLGLGIRCVTIGFAAPGTSGRNTRAQKADDLNTTGLYSLVRHPLYVGNFIIVLGIVLAPMAWWLVPIVCLTYWVYIERVCAAEEVYLAEKFGSRFTDWAARTPAFLPRFDGWRPTELPFSFQRVLRREYHALFVIVTAFFFVELFSDVVFESEPVGQWMREDWYWLLAFCLSATVFLVLRETKRRTNSKRHIRQSERAQAPLFAHSSQDYVSKVPEVTLGFWVVKILATTLGETGGDSVTMTLDWGYLTGTLIFAAVLVGLVIAQIVSRKFHPWLYWTTIVASTTFGTTMADFADRSLGIGYAGGSLLLLSCLMVVLALWYRSQGTISVNTVGTPQAEAFYWAAITFSQTLGTALGDWIADSGGLGYLGGALVFAIGLAVLAALYYWTDVSRVLLFWAAFILTRPLGATVGDLLDKPLEHGGLALSRPIASAVIAAIMVGCILLLPQRPGNHPAHEPSP
jgi:uncharacterized membrane-anchored protein/protein-S-isoprenylcysteine O-methyltransferase Ste14